MNEKHLLWHIFKHLENCDIDINDIVQSFEINEERFSVNPQPGEITVAQAVRERYEAYKKAKVNG